MICEPCSITGIMYLFDHVLFGLLLVVARSMRAIIPPFLGSYICFSLINHVNQLSFISSLIGAPLLPETLHKFLWRLVLRMFSEICQIRKGDCNEFHFSWLVYNIKDMYANAGWWEIWHKKNVFLIACGESELQIFSHWSW